MHEKNTIAVWTLHKDKCIQPSSKFHIVFISEYLCVYHLKHKILEINSWKNKYAVHQRLYKYYGKKDKRVEDYDKMC